MEFKGIKLYIIIFVIIAVIGLFYTGQYLFDIYKIDKPLKEEISAIEGIKDIKIINNNNLNDLFVSFEPGIDFYSSYQKINEVMETKLGSKSGNIIIDNNSSTELEEIYYQIHYAIHEGINTGKFLEMKENVEEIVSNVEIDNYRLWIDNDAVYLQLDKNNSSFYNRIPYNKIITVKLEGGDYIA